MKRFKKMQIVAKLVVLSFILTQTPLSYGQNVTENARVLQQSIDLIKAIRASKNDSVRTALTKELEEVLRNVLNKDVKYCTVGITVNPKNLSYKITIVSNKTSDGNSEAEILALAMVEKGLIVSGYNDPNGGQENAGGGSGNCNLIPGSKWREYCDHGTPPDPPQCTCRAGVAYGILVCITGGFGILFPPDHSPDCPAR